MDPGALPGAADELSAAAIRRVEPESTALSTRNALIAAVAACLVAGSMHVRLRDLGRPDNGDWFKYSASFSTAGAVVSEPAPEEEESPGHGASRRGVWDPLRVPKSILEPPYSWLDTGTAFIAWLPGHLLNGWLAGPTVLDLRLFTLPLRLALIAVASALAAALALRLPPRPAGAVAAALTGVLVALAGTDAGFVSFVPTFFRESTSQLCWLALAALLALPADALRRRRFVLAAVAVAAVASATLHVVLVAPILLAVGVSARRRGAGRIVAVLAPALALAVAFDLASVANRTAKVGAFHALYNGLLPNSSRPAEHLRRLGLPAESLSRLGERKFTASNREFVDAHWRRLSTWSVVRVAVNEPGAAMRLLAKGALRLGDAPEILGAWPRGDEPRALTAWDAPRTALWRAIGRPDVAMVWLLLAPLLAIWGLRRSGDGDRELWPLLLFCSTTALAEIAGAVFGDGVSALRRHLFLAMVALDTSIVVAIVQVVSFAGRQDGRARGAVVRDAAFRNRAPAPAGSMEE